MPVSDFPTSPSKVLFSTATHALFLHPKRIYELEARASTLSYKTRSGIKHNYRAIVLLAKFSRLAPNLSYDVLRNQLYQTPTTSNGLKHLPRWVPPDSARRGTPTEKRQPSCTGRLAHRQRQPAPQRWRRRELSCASLPRDLESVQICEASPAPRRLETRTDEACWSSALADWWPMIPFRAGRCWEVGTDQSYAIRVSFWMKNGGYW